MRRVSPDFDPLDSALMVRDQLGRCKCCKDEADAQENYNAAENLLAWVVDTEREIAVLRARLALPNVVATEVDEPEELEPPKADRKAYQAWWARERRRQTSTKRRQRVDTNVDKTSTARRHSLSTRKKGSPDLSKREEREKTPAFRAVSAELETSEKSGRSDGASTNVDKTSTASTVDVDTHVDTLNGPHLSLWRQIFESWKKHAHDGRRCGDPSRFKADFESVAKDALSRDPKDPAVFADRVISRYVAMKREKGAQLSPRYLAADFAALADHRSGNGNGKAPKSPLLIEIEVKNARYNAAKKSGDRAAEKQLESELEQLGKRLTGHA